MALSARNCARCGRLFNYISGPPICDRCKKALEEEFQKVKTYIQKNPGSNLTQISEDTEVSVSLIKQWIQEERLIFAKGSPVQLTCENCGKPIFTGRFCAKCKTSMSTNIAEAFAKPQGLQTGGASKQQSSANGMRFMRT